MAQASEHARREPPPDDVEAGNYQEAVLSIEGMSCNSCIERVQAALLGINGAVSAVVDLADGKARVRYDADTANVADFEKVVRELGYLVVGVSVSATINERSDVSTRLGRRTLLFPLLTGLSGAVLLMGLYLSIVGLVQSWSHALELLRSEWYFMLGIAVGFGIQVGLFTYIRKFVHSLRTTGSSAALMGVGTGSSTASMLACCAHHVTDIVPIIGLSGLTLFLTAYRVPLMLLGIGINFLGILAMLRLLHRLRSSRSCLLSGV